MQTGDSALARCYSEHYESRGAQASFFFLFEGNKKKKQKNPKRFNNQGQPAGSDIQDAARAGEHLCVPGGKRQMR